MSLGAVKIEFAYAIGSTIILEAIERPGIVTGLLKDENGRQYRVAYWADGVRRCEWVHDFEIRGARQ